MISRLSFAQGGLTPPGGPAPVMKTLQEVEPRWPISSLPYTITNAGSYYLTTNLVGSGSGGITISASGVTLDLRGFELAGGSGSGIFVSGTRTNLVIRNGTIRNWSGDGIGANAAVGSCFEDLRLSQNSYSGMTVGSDSIVRGCIARGSPYGLYALSGSTVSGCIVQGNFFGMHIDAGTIKDCTASGNTYGLSLGSGCLVADCVVNGNEWGISTGTGTGGNVIRNCTVRSNSKDGIQVYNSSWILNNTCDGNASTNFLNAGIHVTGIANRVEGNTVISSPAGMRVDDANNLIIRNAASNNGTNYIVSANNKVGAIVVAPNSAAINGNSGGAGVGTTDPWANISY